MFAVVKILALAVSMTAMILTVAFFKHELTRAAVNLQQTIHHAERVTIR